MRKYCLVPYGRLDGHWFLCCAKSEGNGAAGDEFGEGVADIRVVRQTDDRIGAGELAFLVRISAWETTYPAKIIAD